jgi:hypothetical protein
MEPAHYEQGKYIYECKTSPEKKDGPLNNNSLRIWTRDAKNLLNRYQPSGFRYVFPVNRLDSSNKAILEKLKEDCPGVDIQYYDCDSVDRLIGALEKINSLPDLVAYIKQARK